MSLSSFGIWDLKRKPCVAGVEDSGDQRGGRVRRNWAGVYSTIYACQSAPTAATPVGTVKCLATVLLGDFVRASQVVPIGPWCVYWWERFPSGYRLELKLGARLPGMRQA